MAKDKETDDSFQAYDMNNGMTYMGFIKEFSELDEIMDQTRLTACCIVPTARLVSSKNFHYLDNAARYFSHNLDTQGDTNGEDLMINDDQIVAKYSISQRRLDEIFNLNNDKDDPWLNP
jgi:hypothetical protein